MTRYAFAERLALASLMEEVGAQAPTLCGTWTTRDLAAGGHSIAWEGRLASGERAPSGIYFAQLQTPDGRIESKLVHLAP